MVPKIYHKIDWFSVVFNDASVSEALKSIGFKSESAFDWEAAFNSRAAYGHGFDTRFVFCFDLIRVDISSLDIKAHLPEVYDLDTLKGINFFETRFSSIIMTFSGSCLDRLRSNGMNVDNDFFIPFICDENPNFRYHLTRCDFAFDFVDFMPNFLLDTINLCRMWGDPVSRRVPCNGSKKGLSYSVKEGKELSLYLGSGKSDRLLRFYDKGLEYRMKHVPLSQYPYFDDKNGDIVPPDSWLRLELQTRDNYATNFVYSGLSNFCDLEGLPDVLRGGILENRFLAVLREIYEYYAIREGKGLEVRVSPLWSQLWDWQNIPTIIQNANCVAPEMYLSRAVKWLDKSALRAICTFAANKGWKEVISHFNKYFDDLQTSDDRSSHLRFLNFLDSIYDNGGFEPEHLIQKNGKYYITD